MPLKPSLKALGSRIRTRGKDLPSSSAPAADPSSQTPGTASPATPTPPLMPEGVAQWPPQDWLVRPPVATPGLSFSTEHTNSTSEPSEAESGPVEPPPMLTEEPDEMSMHELSGTLPSAATSSDGTIPSAADADVVLQDEPEEMDEAEAAVLSAEPEDVDEPVSPRAPRSELPRLNLPVGEPMIATASSGASKTPELCASPGGIAPSPVTPVAPPARAAPKLPERRSGKDDAEFRRPDVPRSQQTPALSSALLPDSFPFPRPPMHPSRTPTTSPRTPSAPVTPPAVKETLDARSSLTPDGTRMVNQYILLERIGRGSFGVVLSCIDAETGEHYAAKELSRSRLRRKARRDQARLARRRLARRTQSGRVDEAHFDRQSILDTEVDPLWLVRNEIAIMKKAGMNSRIVAHANCSQVSHPNVVKLHEVLDVSSEDSLYLIIELCEGGPVMDLQINSPGALKRAAEAGEASNLRESKPLEPSLAWDYFRQVILGVAYLHNNEIIHDIKPDNILLTADRKTCKIVDFGVSAVFEKPGDDTGGAAVASPAFASPEQIVAARAAEETPGVHGTASDIWAMGVTLYCMLTGHLPWQHVELLEMYRAIEHDTLPIPDTMSADAADLIRRMLDKDPAKRIKMPQIKEHAYVTARGTRPLPADAAEVERVPQLTQGDLDDAFHIGWSSIRRTFHDAAAVARAHANEVSGGSDRLGAGSRRAFWRAFRKELAERSSESFDRRWAQVRSGRTSGHGSSTDVAARPPNSRSNTRPGSSRSIDGTPPSPFAGHFRRVSASLGFQS